MELPEYTQLRYASEDNDSNKNMDKLLSNLEKKQDRRAHFKTVITLNINNEQYFFAGVCEGEILEEKSGSEGFGYDPIFKPLNHDVSFAEMSMEAKGKISHRGLAIQKLISFLKEYSN